jgi:hypothetical protein
VPARSLSRINRDLNEQKGRDQHDGGDASLNDTIREDGDSAEWQDWLVDEFPDQEATLAASEEFDNRRKALFDALGVLNGRDLRRWHRTNKGGEVAARTMSAETPPVRCCGGGGRTRPNFQMENRPARDGSQATATETGRACWRFSARVSVHRPISYSVSGSAPGLGVVVLIVSYGHHS